MPAACSTRAPLSLRQREIVIDRTTARLGCEYEWGVHIAFFAEKVGFDAEQDRGDRHGPADAACWTADEQALLAAGRRSGRPSHHRRRDLDQRSSAHFDEAQILEAIALVGYYHTISFLCRALDLPLEAYAARFPNASAL